MTELGGEAEAEPLHPDLVRLLAYWRGPLYDGPEHKLSAEFEPAADVPRGTQVVVHLKEDGKDFATDSKC